MPMPWPRHEISVHRQYRGVPLITVDKHQVLQILLNLINNAMYACDGMEKEKIITLGIFSSGEHCLSIQVSDNGSGILSENMTRIFQHGFTTRKAGHGFGVTQRGHHRQRTRRQPDRSQRRPRPWGNRYP